MEMFKRLLGYIVILCFLSACATQKVYEGQARKSEELSVISPPSVSLFKMRPTLAIKEVDGVKLDKTKSGAFEVLPGKHSIKVFLFTVGGAGGGVYSRSRPLEMTFNTEAGKKYIVDYKYEDDKPIFFVSEESTGNRIPWR